jgi:hypothetical protein
MQADVERFVGLYPFVPIANVGNSSIHNPIPSEHANPAGGSNRGEGESKFLYVYQRTPISRFENPYNSSTVENVTFFFR